MSFVQESSPLHSDNRSPLLRSWRIGMFDMMSQVCSMQCRICGTWTARADFSGEYAISAKHLSTSVGVVSVTQERSNRSQTKRVHTGSEWRL